MVKFIIQKLKFLALIGAAATLVACGGGNNTAPLRVSGNAVGNVTAANFATLAGSTFTFPNGLADLGTTAATTVTLGGTAAAPTATITSGGTSVVADVVFGSCRFTYRTPGFGKSTGFFFLYSLCSFTAQTNNQPIVASAQPIPTSLTLGSQSSSPTNVDMVVGAGGSLTVGGKPVSGVTVPPPVTGGGS